MTDNKYSDGSYRPDTGDRVLVLFAGTIVYPDGYYDRADVAYDDPSLTHSADNVPYKYMTPLRPEHEVDELGHYVREGGRDLTPGAMLIWVTLGGLALWVLIFVLIHLTVALAR